MFISINTVEQLKKTVLNIYLEQKEFQFLYNNQIFVPNNKGEIIIKDTNYVLNTLNHIMNIPLVLYDDHLFFITDKDFQNLSNYPEEDRNKFCVKFVCFPEEDITPEELFELLSDNEDYDEYDDYDDEYDDTYNLSNEDEEEEVIYPILKFKITELDKLGVFLKNFDPTKFDIYIYKHEYYLLYYFDNYSDLDYFSIVASEYRCTPFTGNCSFLEEHYEKKLSGEELLPLFEN